MSAKPCKYGCGALISWNPSKSLFQESDGTSHDKARCESLKTKPQAKPAPTLEDAINEIRQSISHLASAVEAIKARAGA